MRYGGIPGHSPAERALNPLVDQQHPHLMGSYLRLSAALYWEGPSIFQ